MNKKLILLVIILIIALLYFGISSYRKVDYYEGSLSYFQRNLYDVLSTMKVKHVLDVENILEYSSNIELLMQINDLYENEREAAYMSRTIGYYMSHFNNELVEIYNGSTVNIDDLNKQLFTYQTILKWYFDYEETDYSELSFDELLDALGEEELKEMVFF